MTDYDFRTLNDKEFEILSVDLIGIVEEARLERFKPGRDEGVDGRYFMHGQKEVILQCKHWCNTSNSQLINRLIKDELPKLKKLNPKKYILSVSNALSRNDKKRISKAFAPYLSEDEIYGNEDLNDLLRSNPDIEQRHYKLWLHSTNILGLIVNKAIHGRSTFALEEVVRNAARYVKTSNHELALEMLDRLGVVIITGEPGVGKTTLADHACLHYVAQGYTYLRLADEIREAEEVFDPECKQIFYFDDFLGRNYLDALRGHEGSHITQFIRRITVDRNKKFILTSRSSILNQGKLLIDNYTHDNIQRNEFELRIQSLSGFDKAQILYNHIWYSNLQESYIEELYYEKRYREVISHENFNPRLISYITDSNRLDDISPTDYWEYIEKSLDNPSQIWDHPFHVQLDDFCRSIILLVVINGSPIQENILCDAYQRFISYPDNRYMNGRHEFHINMRLLTGSLLNRAIPQTGQPKIDLFNPSIGDFVIGLYSRNTQVLQIGLASLLTESSLSTLQSLVKNKFLSSKPGYRICSAILAQLSATNFSNTNPNYLSFLSELLYDWKPTGEGLPTQMREVSSYIIHNADGCDSEKVYTAIQQGVTNDFIPKEQALDFLDANIDDMYGDAIIKAVASLINSIPKTTHGQFVCANKFQRHVIDYLEDCLDEVIDPYVAYGSVDYEDYESAESELATLIKDKLDSMNIIYSESDIDRIIEAQDVPSALNDYFQNTYEPDDGEWGADSHSNAGIDAIDDLFDRD